MLRSLSSCVTISKVTNTMSLFCEYCKYENREISKFCSKCGKPLQTSPVKPPAVKLPVMGILKVDTLLVSRYKVLEMIKAGGMGAVYKTLDEKSNSLCAVKELLPPPNTPDEQKQITEWFKREALILARLEHSSIPKVSDYFVYGGRYYLVMNFIDGEDLLKILLKDGKPGLPEDSVIEWAKQILEVLDYLHNQNPPVIYRDLKPGNIMLQKNGRVKLIDFGIARTLQHDSDSPKTVIGTAGYSPLEQYRGKPEKRSDIFSLGATMHHLLTGIEPETLAFEPLREANPSISPQLEKILLKALQDKVEDRYRNAKEMMKALDFKEKNISNRVKNIISDWRKKDHKEEKIYVKILKYFRRDK